MKHLSLKKLNLLLTVIIVALVSQFPVPRSKAAGPLANCGSGQPYLWANGGAQIPFNPDQGDLGPVDNAGAVAAVQQAFDVWGAVPTSTASYVNAGPLPVDVNIGNFAAYLDSPAPDGLSAIVFDDTGEIFNLLYGPGSGILGFAGPEWGTPATCTIDEGYSFLNGPAFGNSEEALDVMVHEFGHYTNLAHTVVNGQNLIGAGDTSGPGPDNSFGTPVVSNIETMYPFYFGGGSGTNTLHKDDIASISRLYPDASFSSSTGTISGSILSTNGTTRINGVNIIARNIADPFNDAVSAISGDFTDGAAQSDLVVGTYKMTGLTPGAQYAVFIDEILAGGFSTAPIAPFPGPEEFYNGANESSSGLTDVPSEYTAVTAVAANEVGGVNIIINAPVPGAPLPVGDDGNVQIPLPFSYALCGQSFDSVFVNANGNLTFGSGDTDFSESAAEMLSDQPRIAGLWDDLNASAGGTVYYLSSKNEVIVVYDSVPEFPNAGSNSFSISMKRASNHVDISYGDISAVDGIGGISCAGAVTSRFETPVDLTSYGTDRINLKRSPAVFEVWNTANPTDVAGRTVRFNGTMEYNDNWAGKNDSFGKARYISLPFDSIPIERYTEIEPVGADVDFFAFDLVQGTTLLAEIKTGSLDSLIGLFDPAGNLVTVDDDGGTGLLSRIVYAVPASGRYRLAVTTFPDNDFMGAGGSGGRYVMDLSTIDGELLNLGDDSSQEVELGFSFPFNGSSYTSVFVNSNGNLTFGSGDTDFSETITELLNDQPRIAPLWDDLTPNAGGLVLLNRDADSVTVEFREVPEFLATTGNTFRVTLFSDGRVEVVYGAITATDGIAGVSPGGGAADPGGTNLSAGGPFSATGVTYELFNAGNPNDLDFLNLNYNP